MLMGSKWENPKGIQAQSPGLRGTSYPGKDIAAVSTLNGLRLPLPPLWHNPVWDSKLLSD
jgi:hypothetical protein